MVAVETPSDSFRALFTHPLLQGCVVVALAVVIAIAVEIPGRFPDPDSFYHAGMAELAAAGQFPAKFPWAELTTLRSAYADLHFGYHLVLVPFIRIFGSMAGIRIATITLFAATAFAWWFAMRRMRLRGAFAWTLLLLGSAAFVFRLNLAKSQGLAFVLLAIGLACIFRKSYLGLFLTAVFAAWTSAHWPVLALAATAAGIAQVIVALLAQPFTWRHLGSAIGHACTLVVSVGAGIIAAHIVNPYFPENLAVARQQILEIAVIGARGGVISGLEWAPLAPLDFARAVGFLAPIALAGIIGLILHMVRIIGRGGADEDTARDDAARALACTFLAVTFAVLTLRSQRHIEFFIPLAILAIAAASQPVIAWCWPARIRIGWREHGVLRRPFATIIVVIGLAAFTLGAIRDIGAQRAYFANGYRADRLTRSAAWLHGHAPAGAVVFHADWSDFPFLFRANREQRYLVGLDPMFAYLTDAQRFHRWVAVGRGEVAAPASVMRKEFRASYALVMPEEAALGDTLARDRHATRVYGDDEATIYQLTP